MDRGFGLFLVGFVLVLAIVGLAWYSSRSRTLLQRWASRNGYRIIGADHRSFFRGPFFWTSSKGQTVYRVAVQIGTGAVLRGWVRCGSWCFGLLSDRVEVRWDEAPVVAARGAKANDPMHDRWLDG